MLKINVILFNDNIVSTIRGWNRTNILWLNSQNNSPLNQQISKIVSFRKPKFAVESKMFVYPPATLLGGVQAGLTARTLGRGFSNAGVLTAGIHGRYRCILPFPTVKCLCYSVYVTSNDIWRSLVLWNRNTKLITGNNQQLLKIVTFSSLQF